MLNMHVRCISKNTPTLESCTFDLHGLILTILGNFISVLSTSTINVVALRQTRLVLGWVTVCGRVNHFGM